LPMIAESNTVLTLSVALLFYGAMAGSMDVAMNTHAVMLEKRYQRHIMSSFHALFSLGGMAGSALGGLVASRAVPAGIHFWVSGIALAAMSILAYEAAARLGINSVLDCSPLPSRSRQRVGQWPDKRGGLNGRRNTGRNPLTGA
jgi:MFS family permease